MMFVPLGLRGLGFGRCRVERPSRPCSLSEEAVEEACESGCGPGEGEDLGCWLGEAMEGRGCAEVVWSSVGEAMV